MKTLLVLSLLAAADRIEEVVVYPDRAQVKRVTQVDCGPKAAALFERLPASADPGSLRARVEGGTLEGLRSEERPRRKAFSEPLNALDAQLKALDAQLAAANDAKQVAARADALATSYERVAVEKMGRELPDRADPKAWGAAFDAVLATKLKAAEDGVAVNERLRQLSEQRAELAARRALLENAAGRKELAAEVLVGCAAGRKATVELTYLVGGAGWQPQYEARAQEGEGTVELSTFGTLSQTTGEPWTQARLLLSTALPSQNATPPVLSALRVSAEERKEEKKVLVRRDEVVERAQAGSSDGPGAGQGLQARAQGLSVQLEVPEPADIPGDGTPARVFVSRQRLKAKLAYRAIPKLAPYVYRMADLTNTAPFPLLPGSVAVFRGNSFVARHALERVPEGGFFQLGFGADESLRVKRTVLEELRRDVGLFGGKRRFHYAYRFELSNFGKQPVEVELAEHVPISELDDITVLLTPQTTAGYQLNPADGVATWKLPLRPTDKRKVELAFDVDVPSSYESGGL